MNEPLDSMELARVVYQTVMGHLRLNPRWGDISPEAREAWEAGALKVASVTLERYLELSQAITSAGHTVIEEHGRHKAETSLHATRNGGTDNAERVTAG